MKKILFLLLILFILTGCSASIINSQTDQDTSVQRPAASQADNALVVHFIDVGQGDSILIQAPSGKNMLIDAGTNASASAVVNYLKNRKIKRLDILVATHPHEDHIGGMDAVINKFDIGMIYMPDVSTNTKTYADVLTAVKNRKLKVTTAAAGIQMDLGPGLQVRMFAPNSDKYDDMNNYSAVIKLTYSNTSFLFTGDAQSLSEQEMLTKGYDLKADVLKVGHHGSNSSTSPGFLKAVSPEYAVISVGKGNDYGHPHKETLTKLAGANVKVFRTDKNGTIIARSNGNTILWETAK